MTLNLEHPLIGNWICPLSNDYPYPGDRLERIRRRARNGNLQGGIALLDSVAESEGFSDALLVGSALVAPAHCQLTGLMLHACLIRGDVYVLAAFGAAHVLMVSRASPSHFRYFLP
jgi:hypothetical protein